MNYPISLQRTTSREIDFNCPDGEKSTRWEITFTNDSDVMKEALKEDGYDEQAITYTTDFTAYGENSDTELGALKSFANMLSVYEQAYSNSCEFWRKVNLKNKAYEFSNIDPIERKRENGLEDVCDTLLASFIRGWKGDKRTSFGLDEIGRIEGYRYIIYGAMNLIYSLFNDDQFDGNYNIKGYPLLFDYYSELQDCVNNELIQRQP